jgi:AI-2 transport protein TqsA
VCFPRRLRYGHPVNLGRGAKAVVLVAALVGVGAGIKLSAPVLVPFLLAMFIATVTAPLALWMVDRGVPRVLAVILTVLIDLGALAGFAALVGTSFNAFYAQLPQYQRQLAQLIQEAYAWAATYGVQVQEPFSMWGDPREILSLITSLLGSIANIVSNLVLVLLIVVFMLFEATGIREKLARVLVPESLARIRGAAREVNKYLLVKTGTSLATGILAGVWCAVWDVDLPLLWGLLAFVLNYIPTVGSIIASIPPILLATLQFGPGRALAVLTGYLVINFTIGNFLEPRIFGRALGMSPLFIFLSIVLWGWLLGPVGALLSVPLTMTLKIFLANTEDGHWLSVLLEPTRQFKDADGVATQGAPKVGHAGAADSSTP